MSSPFIPSSFTYGDAPAGGVVMPTIIASRNPSNTIDKQYSDGYLWLSALDLGGSGNFYIQSGFSAGVPGWTLLSAGAGVLNTISSVVPIANNINLFGTPSQISISPGPGELTLSLPASITTPGSLTVTGLLTASGGVSLAGPISITGGLTTDTLTSTSTTSLATTGALTTTIGNNTGASKTKILIGTGDAAGDFAVTGVTSSIIKIGTSITTGAITVGGAAQTGDIVLGSSSGSGVVKIGNGAGASTVNIAHIGTVGNTVNICGSANTVKDTVAICSGASAGDVEVDILNGNATAGTLVCNVFGAVAATTAGTTNINTGACAHVLNVGSSSGGNQTYTLALGKAWAVAGGTTTTFSLGGASVTTGTLLLGGSGQTGSITLGSTSGPSQSVLIANGAGATGVVSIANVSTAGMTINIGQAVNTATNALHIFGGASASGASSVDIMDGATPGANQSLTIMSGIASAGAQSIAILGGANTTGTQTFSVFNGAIAGATSNLNLFNGVIASGTNTINEFSSTLSGGTNKINLFAGAFTGGTNSVNIFSGAFTTVAATFNLFSGASTSIGTANINTGTSAAHVTNIGSNAGGNVTVKAGATGTIGIGLGGNAAQLITIGAIAQTGKISIADSTAAMPAVDLMNGVAAGAQVLNIASGTTITAAQTVNLLNGATPAASTTLNIMNGAGSAGTQAVAILSTGATRAGTYNIGDGGAAHVGVIGSTTASASLTLQAGTGATGLKLSAAGNIQMVPATGTAASPTASVTMNNRFGVATFTGFTTAAAATQAFTITNSTVLTTSAVSVTVTHLNASGNAAKIAIVDVTQAAGSIIVTVLNQLGAGSLGAGDSVLITFWILS